MSDIRHELSRNYEQDFDRAQGQIRQAASVWTLAGFAAFAYVLSLEQVPDSLTRYSFGVLVSFASAFGVAMLWFIDQLVYQRLLHSAFVHGLYLEWREKNLPQIRTKMYCDNLNISFNLSLFYIVPVGAFLITAIYFATEEFLTPPCGSSDIFVLILLIMHIFGLKYMVVHSLSDRKLVERHGKLYPEEFQNYLRTDQVRTTFTERHKS